MDTHETAMRRVFGPRIRELRQWLADGVNKGASYMLVVCDASDYCDYPVYVLPSAHVRDVERHHAVEGRVVSEIYNLSLDIEAQLREQRAWNY